MNNKSVLSMLEETNAVMHGHFLLTSGLHSPIYVEKFNVLQRPEYTEQLCKEIASRFINDNVELVVGPMTGGILLAYEVAKNLGTRFFFTERVNGKMTFKRGFAIKPGTCPCGGRYCNDGRQCPGSARCRQGRRRRSRWCRPPRRPQRRQSGLWCPHGTAPAS